MTFFILSIISNHINPNSQNSFQELETMQMNKTSFFSSEMQYDDAYIGVCSHLFVSLTEYKKNRV